MKQVPDYIQYSREERLEHAFAKKRTAIDVMRSSRHPDVRMKALKAMREANAEIDALTGGDEDE